MMTTMTIEQAAERLVAAIQRMDADDLLEVYGEFYPQRPAPPNTGKNGALRQLLVEHIEKGLEIEEVIDAWTVAFPKDPNLSYDEEVGTLSFDERSETISAE